MDNLFEVSRFDSETLQVIHGKAEFCVCGEFEGQEFPAEVRAKLIAQTMSNAIGKVALDGISGHSPKEWAQAIAERIFDEGGLMFGANGMYGEGDRDLLAMVLAASPLLVSLVGTQFIEDEYFEPEKS